MLATIGLWLGRSALMTSPLGGPLKALLGGLGRLLGIKVSLRVWMLVAALAFAWHWHHGKVKVADAAGYARAMGEVEAKAIALKTKIDTLAGKITDAERNRNNEERRRIDGRADSLLLRGPGKAVCPGGARATGSADRAPPAGQVDVGVAQLPDVGGVELIAVPYIGAVKFGQQADKCEADLASIWRAYDALVKIWPKVGPQQPAPAAARGNP